MVYLPTFTIPNVGKYTIHGRYGYLKGVEATYHRYEASCDASPRQGGELAQEFEDMDKRLKPMSCFFLKRN